MSVHQLDLIADVFVAPKRAFRSLPSDRWLVLAWVIPIYFGVGRSLRSPSYEANLAVLGPILFYSTLLIAAIVVPLLSSLVLHFFLRIFGKRLTVRKLMNIYGYALAPRLIISLAGSALLFRAPWAWTGDLTPAPELKLLLLLEMLSIIYGLALWIYGIIVSPSENQV